MSSKKLWLPVFAVLLSGLFLAGQGIPFHSAARAHPLGTALVFLLAALAVAGRSGKILADGFDRLCRMPRSRFNAGVFLLAGLAYALVAWFIFQGIPRIDDGMASLFQERLFAHGVITLPLPPDADFMDIFGVLGVRQGRRRPVCIG